VAACSTLTAIPATLTVALLSAPALAATENRIVALPSPLLGIALPIQVLPLVAVHAHPLVAVSPRSKDPPVASMPTSDLFSSNVQGAPSCTISTRCSTTCTAPRRCFPTAFGATV
jgi:hypothetical protein